MSLPPAHHAALAASSEAPIQDQAKLLEALRTRTQVAQQFKEYQAQKAQQLADTTTPPTPVEEGPYSASTLGSKKIHEIKDILREMGKRVTGNKEDLIAVRTSLLHCSILDT